VLLALAAPLLGATARAQDRLSLAWGDCRLGGGRADSALVCGDLLDRLALVCSFSLASPVDSVIGAEFVIDVQSAESPLPDFWEFGTGGCNSSGPSAIPPPVSSCADAWGGLGSALLLEARPGEPGGAPSRIRLIVEAWVPSTQARTLDAGVSYDAVALEFASERLGRCAGCRTPACLVLNSVRLLRAPGALDLLISGADSFPDNFATWAGGAGADCNSVPTRRSTWGRVKALYR
jgi:hypothetical protein